MIARIQIRRDKESNWAANNPILTLGEIGYDEDTEKFKVGISNSSRWNDLPYELGQWKTDESGNISYGYASDGPAEGNVSINNDLFVGGDLTVKGTTTTINTEVATFKDDIIQLNLDVDDTGIYSGTLQSGFEVNRGNVPSIGLSSQKIYWDEADGPSGRWVIDTDLNVLGDIYSNGTALWRLNGNDIYFDNGYVAIGLDNPSSVLHIKDVTPIITLEDENNPAHIWNVGQNADKFFINTETADDGSMFSILDDGKVGIGTNNPSAKLDIISDITGTSTEDLRITNSTVTNQWHRGIAVLHPNISNTNSGLIMFGNAESTGDSGHISFKNSATDGEEQIQIGIFNKNSLLNIQGNGNVGIGTESPGQILHVGGDVRGQIYIDGTPTQSPTLTLDHTSYTNGRKWVLYSGGSAAENFDIYDATANLTRFSIDENGNVGIGTDDPPFELTVEGRIYARDGIHVQDRRNAPTDNPAGPGDIEPTDWAHKSISTFFTNQISGSPNVWDSGITVSGWDNTSYKVWQLFANSELDSLNSSDDLYFRTGAGNTWGTLQKVWTDVNLPPSAMGQWTTVTNGINYSGGNVGIGTASPSSKLDINTGAMSASIKIGNFDNVDIPENTDQFGEGTKLEFIADTNPKYSEHVPFTVAYMKAEYDGTGADTKTGDTALTFATYDGWRGSAAGVLSEKMRISSSGNVGINIISPETKLDINSNTLIGNETLLRFRRGATHGNSGFNQYYNLDAISSGISLWGLNFGLGVTSDSDGGVGIKFESRNGSSTVSDKIIFRTSGTNQVDIDNSGNLTASGTITSTSDITLKENIELISDPIEKVKELGGYTFNKKGEDLRLVGLIAQEVEKVLPEAVHENQEGLKSLAYGNLVALLVECVKNQDERIESLERTIKEMK
ncbi:MAG: hypothetical protein CMP21_03835 [Rickettsiales bacterium]|nr:hypothetical protein [Rickettsiales bacterium]|tara:strand:- start:28712 stop:31411 length:2700 start_codon:yes stop_codon:yes gene_type:complete